MKKIGTYWKAYIVLVLVLVLLGIVLGIYTRNSLTTYEKCQPEKIVRQEMSKIQNAVKLRTLNVLMDVSKYNKETLENYYELMDKAKEWNCKVVSGGYSDTAQCWGIFADDQLVAEVNLSGTNTRTMLLILTASDWTVSGIVSGLDLIPTPTPGPTEAPVVITKYEYNLTLPASYTVITENQVIKGTASGNQVQYNFKTTENVIKIKDAYGTTIDYKHGDSISGHNVVVKLPDNFKLTLKDVDVEKYALPEKEDIKALTVCYDFADNLPKIVVYHFDDALKHPDFEITDQNGKKLAYEYEGDAIIFNNLTKEDKLPEEISSVTDVMKLAEMWSLLMTKDLGDSSDSYGYNKMKKYIAAGSPLLAVAKGFINSDIWTISNHTLVNPPFSDESVSGYVRYSENVFSVDVRLTKALLTKGSTKPKYDVTSDTIFFIKNTGSGEPWLMVDMMSNLDK